MIQVKMKRSGMYGNRGGVGRFDNQPGLLGNGNLMMGNPMTRVANIQQLQLLNQGAAQRGAGLFQINPSLGMQKTQQQQAGFNQMNMAPQPQAVLDILVIIKQSAFKDRSLGT